MAQKNTDFYKSNLKILKKHHPATFRQIKESPPEPVGNISYNPDATPNLTVINDRGDSILLHKAENPADEAKALLQKIPKRHKGFIAILGMGLGYHVLPILEEMPGLQHLAIFDLEPGIFIQALKFIDLSSILQDPRVILCIGSDITIEQALKPAERTLQLEDASVLHHSRSFEYKQTEYENLKGELFVHLNRLNVGGTTTMILGQNFFNNRFKHLCTIHHQYLLDSLQNKFTGIPAILVAGGPSLNKNIHQLKQARDKAVIIAVDAALPTLLKNGIQPHFLSCIDPNNLTYEKFSDVTPKVKNISLICSSWVNPKTPQIFPAEHIFWTFTAKPMEAWLNFLFGGRLLTSGAGTVAHLNLIAADVLGCDPIIFIGQDLAYPESATHAEGTVLQGSSPTNPVANDTEGETVKGIDGTILRTNRSFLSMKAHFEGIIANAQQTYINATEGGAHIEGTRVASLQETLDQHCKSQISISKKLTRFQTSAPAVNTENMQTAFEQMRLKIKQLQKDIKKTDKITHPLLKELEKSGQRQIESFNMLSSKQQKHISKIDHYHKDIDGALEVWKILEEITTAGLKESERRRQEITLLEKNQKQYNLWLVKNLERLTGINEIRKKTLKALETNIDMVISFHKKESSYLEKIKIGDPKMQSRLNLARLYITSKNYYLAKPVVKELHSKMPESAEIYFYLGCIATQYSEHSKAAGYFKTAANYDPAYLKKIDRFRHDLGDEFMDFVRYFKTQPGREKSILYMILKGLKHCPFHEHLKGELQLMADQNLETVRLNLENNDFEQAALILNRWIKDFTDQENLADSISKESVTAVYLNKGKLHLKEKNYSKAISNFKKALDYSPLDPDLHFITIDTLFVANRFDRAIEAINVAIRTDKQFASYWETIGDNLAAGNQHEDAVLAYENCFVHQPHNIYLLKKIGDCYLAADQLEAAKAAFQQFKLKMKDLGLPGAEDES